MSSSFKLGGKPSQNRVRCSDWLGVLKPGLILAAFGDFIACRRTPVLTKSPVRTKNELGVRSISDQNPIKIIDMGE